MHLGKLLQRIGVGREATLGFLETLCRQLELVEEDLAQLDRRIEIERMARELEAFALQTLRLGAELQGNSGECIPVNTDTRRFHLGQHARDRKLDLAEEPLKAAF